MVRPSIRTARVASLKRAPWQVGQPDGDVGQVLDVEVDVAQPAAGRALALAGVEREVPGLPSAAAGRTRTRRIPGGSGRTRPEYVAGVDRVFWPIGEASIWTI